MNRTISIVLILIALGLIVYNTTQIDFENPLNGGSSVALIGILAPLCAIILLLIYMTSKRIDKKIKDD